MGPLLLEGVQRRPGGAARRLVAVWIATWQTGHPYSQDGTNDINRDGNTRNDIVPGRAANSESLPDYLNVDLRVAKRLPLWREVDLELIAEAFNLFDRDNIVGQRNVFYNFDVTNTVLIPQANFGQDLTAADNRIVQLAAKISF